MEKTAYMSLKEELDRTAVISRDFRNVILAWAAKIAEEAYTKGRQEAQSV